MGLTDHFGGMYQGRKVLVTGHTGFKGSWLCLWLQKLGAEVIGISLPNDNSKHFELLALSMKSYEYDISNPGVMELIREISPDVVFHLAAQALVRRSYNSPIETYQSNLIGSLHVYEACRQTPSVKALVSITSDKVYENKEWHWPYRENDRLGGKDPYSASKACVELMTHSYRESFLKEEKSGILLATTRSGNVIGGGDWAEDRIVPDVMRATYKGEAVRIRNPHSIRPWQHVLDPLSGYLVVGQKLLEHHVDVAVPWNFGPNDANHSVRALVDVASEIWDKLKFELDTPVEDRKEAGILHIDNSLAGKKLEWHPIWDFEQSVRMTVHWYRAYFEGKECNSERDLNTYLNDAVAKQVRWARS